jgi:hypothetical protein
MAERPPRRGSDRPERPWVIPVIATVAGLVVVAGVVWASILGHLF